MKDGRDETFEADAVDEHDQAPDHEEAIVESAPEYLKTIEAESKDTDIVWRLRRQLPGWRSAGQSWVEHLLTIVVCQTGIFPLCRGHRSFIGEVDVAWCLNCTWMTYMELGRRVPRNNSSIMCQRDGAQKWRRM